MTVTLKARSGTWADLDEDFEYDAETEKKKAYPFGAAVQLPAPEGSELPGGRVVVAMDSQLIVDELLAQVWGNNQWFQDSVLWLDDTIELAGEVADIEDVLVLHSQSDDTLWFYGSIFGVPLFVLGAGVLNARRRRKKKS